MGTPAIDEALEQLGDRRALLSREETIHAEATNAHAAARAALEEAERAYSDIRASDAPDAKVGAAFNKVHGAKARADDALARVRESARLVAVRRDEVARAEAAHERATLEQAARDAENAPEVAELGQAIVGHVLGLRSAVSRVQRHIAAGAARAKRLRELGATIPEPDGTAIAAALAGALHANGGGLPEDGNEHRLRHAFEWSTMTPDPTGHGRVMRLLTICLESLTTGARPDRASWRDRLGEVAEAWRGKANRVEAERALQAARQAHADAKATDVARAHERRRAGEKERAVSAIARLRTGVVEWLDRAPDRLTAPQAQTPVHPVSRAREAEVRAKLAAGEMYEIDDFEIPKGVE